MSVGVILLPLFALVLLTFATGFYMAFQRQRAFAAGLRWRDIALREPNWPRPAQQAAHAYANLLELPILFYVLTILALVTRQADLLFVVLAWIFVLARILQAYVHVTSNYVPLRGAVFAVGVVVLFVMWLVYIVRILSLSPA